MALSHQGIFVFPWLLSGSDAIAASMRGFYVGQLGVSGDVATSLPLHKAQLRPSPPPRLPFDATERKGARSQLVWECVALASQRLRTRPKPRAPNQPSSPLVTALLRRLTP